MIPLAKLKKALKIEPDQEEEDAYLVELEAAAVAHCERLTGRHFGEPQQFTEVIEGYGERDLWLTNEPAEVALVTLVWTPGGAMSQAVPPSAYRVQGRRLVGAGGWGYSSWPHDVEVVYTAGYAAAAEPADIRVAVLQLVGLWFEARLPVALGTVAPEVPHSVAALLAPWKVWRA